MRRNYTEDELFFIETNWGRMSVKGIANRLNRSETGIKIKAHKLGLGDPLNHRSFLIAKEVEEILGVTKKTVTNYIHNYGLKGNAKYLNGRKCISIQYKDLIDWLINNPERWDGSKIDRLALESIGMNMECFNNKIEADIENKNRTTLTDKDIESIKKMYKDFIRYEDIANKLNKNYVTVKWKIHTLIESGELESNTSKGRLVRGINRDGYGWEEWQDKLLIKEFRNGTKLKDIAIMVGKTLPATKSRNQMLSRRMMNGLAI